MEFVAGDPHRGQGAHIAAVLKGKPQRTRLHHCGAGRGMNSVEDHRQILPLACWLAFHVDEMGRVSDRFEDDYEFGWQLQRYQRLLAGWKFDCLDGNFFEVLLKSRFRQIDPRGPKNLPEVFPYRKEVGIVRRDPAQAGTDGKGDLDHLIKRRLIAGSAQCAVICILVHGLEGLCGLEYSTATGAENVPS